MSQAIGAAVERLLNAAVVTIRPMAGGDLSSVNRVVLEGGRIVVAKRGAQVATEARMLGELAQRNVPAPAVLGVDGGVLLMSEVDAGSRLGGAAWDDLAAVLARLHGNDARRYGWEEDYAFGPVTIDNGWSEDWPAFWAERRLYCHLPHLPAMLRRQIEALGRRIGELLPARPPAALLHGDLWGGNVMVADERITGLIDPACYYGDREVDVAMLALFDAPPEQFFSALNLAEGWRERQSIYRLWPLLVHVRLFGGGYITSAEGALKAIGF